MPRGIAGAIQNKQITLKLRSSIADRLQQKALQKGLTLAELLRQIAEQEAEKPIAQFAR